MKITTFIGLGSWTFRFGRILLLMSLVSGQAHAAAHFQVLNSQVGDLRMEGADGQFYGVTREFFQENAGTIFQVNKDGSGHRVLKTFSTNGFDGTNPDSLVAGSDGVLYGTTGHDGSSNDYRGVVFKLNKDGTAYGILRTFGSTPVDGQLPSGLIEGKDGVLYGVTRYGGAETNHQLGWGTVFRLNRDGTGYGIIHHFGSTEADGAVPNGGLLQGSDGALYGTTWFGGSNGYGTVFKLATDGSNYSILKHFDFGCAGGYPWEGMIEDSDGVLYGTTGDWYCDRGTVFRINKDGTGFRVILNTVRLPSAIVEGLDGDLYGTTEYGGAYTNASGGLGTLFKVNKDGTGYSLLHNFTGGEDGSHPGDLIRGSDGALYGTTDRSHIASGTLFRFWPPETPDVIAVRVHDVAQITIAGTAGYHYQVLRSTNLQNWSGVTNFTMPPEGRYLHIDNASPAPAAFYRAAWIPR